MNVAGLAETDKAMFDLVLNLARYLHTIPGTPEDVMKEAIAHYCRCPQEWHSILRLFEALEENGKSGKEQESRFLV